MSDVVSPSVGPAPNSGSSGSGSLYGRKYQLLVSTQGGEQVINFSDSSFEPEALRITFNVYTPCIHSAYWFADIDIYNLDTSTNEELVIAASNIGQGAQVTLSAGYASGNYDIIWMGPVFQATLSRENVVDLKLSLHCIYSMESVLSGAVISTQYAAGMTQPELIVRMLNSLGLHQNYLSPNIKKTAVSRGGVLFGAPDKYFDQIARDNNMVWFINQRGFSMGALNDDLNSTPAPGFVYGPKSGLIGTPEQTQSGVDFSILLDPRVKAQLPLMTVGIDQSLIRQYKLQIGEVIRPLDNDGTYVVGAIRHRGDSRGNIWQTDITGYTNLGEVLGLLGQKQNANVTSR